MKSLGIKFLIGGIALMFIFVAIIPSEWITGIADIAGIDSSRTLRKIIIVVALGLIVVGAIMMMVGTEGSERKTIMIVIAFVAWMILSGMLAKFLFPEEKEDSILFGGVLYAGLIGGALLYNKYKDEKYLKREQKADQGDAAAQYEIGLDCEEGNRSEALKRYRQAARQGHAAAQYALGRCTDGVESLEWHKRAAAGGVVEAQEKLNSLSQESLARDGSIEFDTPIKLYQKAVKRNHSDAQFRLGVFYLKRIRELDEDVIDTDIWGNKEEARHWLEKAADQGHAGAKKTLAENFK